MSDEDDTESEDSKINFISPDDKVVSEVNPFLVSSMVGGHLLQKSSNLIATITFSLPLKFHTNEQATTAKNNELVLDKDGDLVLVRDETVDENELQILIEYENATTLNLVGLQIWRGAFLLSDFVVHNYLTFQGKNIVELGSGTGLVGIVGSLFAENVVLTDLNEPSILDILRANIIHNQDLLKNKKLPSIIPLDFMADAWSKELTDVISSSDVILAADVIYHVEITNAFIRTLKNILVTGNRPKDIFIALEKRYVFTIEELDTFAPMHNHFLEEIDAQLRISPGCMPQPIDGKNNMEISMISVPLDFKQYFNYERCKELVMYHIKMS